MAVVSISKIQVRRGLKNSDSGLPQLASGEFGWAMDAQELYIGNGSIAEGAPFIGNTRILTSQDNIFKLTESYEYRGGELQTGATLDDPITRNLQDRLDDRVSIRSFGARGNGELQADQIQNAIDQVYSTDITNPASRVILHVEPGLYLLDHTVTIPPHAKIECAGVGSTIFETTGDFPAFEFSPSPSPSGTDTTYNTQSRRVRLTSFTVRSRGPALRIPDCRNSEFSHIHLEYLGNATDQAAIELASSGTISGVVVQKNKFRNITTSGYAFGTWSATCVFFNKWIECDFQDADYGVYLNSQTSTSEGNWIIQSDFKNIRYNGVFIENGVDCTSTGCSYSNVGHNDGGRPLAAFHTDHFSNTSIDDFFSTSESYYSDVNSDSQFTTPIDSSAITTNQYTQRVSTESAGVVKRLLKLPAREQMGYVIDYLYRSVESNTTRTGTIEVALNTDLDLQSPIEDRNNVSMCDEYSSIGESASTLAITAQLADDDTDGVVESLILDMENSNASDTGEILFRITTKG